MNNLFSTLAPFPITRRFFTGMITLATNIIWGRILNRRSPRGPVFLTWLLTFDCNAYCTFCGTHMLKKQFPEKLDLNRALEIADEIADAGTWVVGFTGGEVFLSPLLFPLIKRLKERGLVVYIVTNGHLLGEYAEQLVDLEVDTIVVSIDFDNAEQHNEARKLEKLFENAIAGIKKLNKIRRNSSPVIRVNSILMQDTIHRIPEIFDFLEDLADDVTTQPISLGNSASPHCRGEERMDKFIFDNTEETEINQILDKHLLSRKPFRNSYYKNILDYWFDPGTLATRTPCWAPFLRMLIQPTGEVLHCAANERFGAFGDLRNSSLMETWNSETIKHDREIIGRKKNNCICWTRDTAFNSLMADIPLINKLPYLGEKQSNKVDNNTPLQEE